MKYVLVSKDGDFLPLLHRMERDGVEVVAYIDESDDIHEGMTPTAHDALEIEIAKKDLVIFDMVGAGKAADRIRSMDQRVLGGGLLNDRIELDRSYGETFMRKAGIVSPKSYALTDFTKARRLIESTGKRYVFKPDGNMDTSLTYVSSSAENLLSMLPWLEDQVKDTKFSLQEFVEGVEMSTEMWFNGTRFVHPANSTMEEKKLFAGSVGPATGCMGNVVWAWDDSTSEWLYRRLFMKLEPALKEAGYLGPLDINAIWTPDEIYGLEWSARFGYDAIQAFSRLFTTPFHEVLNTLEGIDRLPVNSEHVSFAVRVSIPPFPNDGEVPEVPILGDIDEDLLYWSDVKRKDNQLVCAGTDGYICAVAADAPSLTAARDIVYKQIDKLEVPNKQYRIDIGDRYESDRREIGRIIKRQSDKETKNSS